MTTSLKGSVWDIWSSRYDLELRFGTTHYCNVLFITHTASTLAEIQVVLKK